MDFALKMAKASVSIYDSTKPKKLNKNYTVVRSKQD